MSSPKVRFALMVAILVVVWWAYAMVSTYLLGERGLNFARYAHGVAVIGSATAFGFLLVWAAVLLLRRHGHDTDASLPHLIATPRWPNLHPLEAELIGFLNGYRHWPASASGSSDSLYDHALRRWDVVRARPGATPLQRIAALAMALKNIPHLQEVRLSPSLLDVGRRDTVRFQPVSSPPSDAAFRLLAGLPSYSLLHKGSEDSTHALADLLAPHPHLDHPLTRELADILVDAEHHLPHADAPEALHPDDISLLAEAAQSPRLFDGLVFQPHPVAGTSAVLLEDGHVLLGVSTLLQQLAPLLPDALRSRLKLTYDGGTHHPAWPLVRNTLADAGVVVLDWDGTQANSRGTFMVRLNNHALGPFAMVVPDNEVATRLKHDHAANMYRGLVAVEDSGDVLRQQLGQRAAALDERLKPFV